MLKAVKINNSRENFFTPLRIFMAILVVFGHATVVKTGNSSDEASLFYHYASSYTAVNAFFIVSGFLVTKSMLLREDLASFSSARILRIFPALLLCVLLLTFVMGPIITTLSLKDYLTHPDTLTQPIKVLSFVSTDMYLPQTFIHNAEQISGGSLWTLRFEVICYIGTAIAFALGLLKRRWMIAAQFVGFSLAYIATMRLGLWEYLPDTVQVLIRFGIAYGLGAAIYAYRDKIKFHILAIPALLGATALLNNQPEMDVMYNISLAAIIFWLAYIKAPKLKFLQKLDDISYGIYIYHWAVLQVLVSIIPSFPSLPLALITIGISGLLAWLSWVLLEKRALESKDKLTHLLSRNHVKTIRVK